jgi:hypothetical protein
MPNRLASERSPYLLQHAENPVEWYPWGEDAFEKARRENKPIFLSIGYSTCHWCHVMEHESFESGEIAELLNRDFVSIKVDREERPDVDRVYMTFVQATTGAGGWPMSVWLTPELKPFYGGTYYPPSSRWGRPGFTEVLAEIARMWKEDRARVDRVAEDLMARLEEATTSRPGPAEAGPHGAGLQPGQTVADADALALGVEQYRRAYDARHGGFGQAPKFPRPSEYLFLLREHARTGGDARTLEMVLHTLRAMALGGMRDHVGGGFHRYSVDAEWRVPHFEKMLYDQAQLVLAYLEAAQASLRGTGAPGGADAEFYASVAEDTIEYVLRDLLDERGGFYSAEDADSVPPEAAGEPHPHKTEGAFYLWTDEELRSLLGADADVVCKRFGVQPNGNALQDPQGEFTGKNILFIDQPTEDVAIRTGRAPDDVVKVLERARRALFETRSRRPRPHLDDKVLTSWNGLMIAALARAGRVIPSRDRRRRYLEAAQRAARFTRDVMWRDPEGTLLRRYRKGEAAIEGYCEDYAYLIWALLELVQADGDPRWLEWALRLQQLQDDLFWDEREGGWFSTTGRDPSVLLRMKEDYDGAEPAPGSVATMNLLSLAHLTGRRDFTDRAARALARYGPRLGEAARARPFIMAALSTWHAGLSQIVVIGQPDRDDTERMTLAVARRYLPFALVLPVEPGERQAALARHLPFIAPMTMRDGHATAHVCRDFTCQAPATQPEALEAQLEGRP